MIKFDKKVATEIQELLIKELKEYEKEIKMTKTERKDLYEWVASGRSPYDNGSYVCYEGGQPMDFINALRFIQEEAAHYESLSEEEKSEYQGCKETYDTDSDEPMIMVGASDICLDDLEDLPFK